MGSQCKVAITRVKLCYPAFLLPFGEIPGGQHHLPVRARDWITNYWENQPVACPLEKLLTTELKKV